MRMGGSEDCVLLWNWGWDWGIRSVGTERAEGEEMNYRQSTWLSYRSDLLAESACWIWDGAAAGFLLQSLGWTRGLYFEGGGQWMSSDGLPVSRGCSAGMVPGSACGCRMPGQWDELRKQSWREKGLCDPLGVGQRRKQVTAGFLLQSWRWGGGDWISGRRKGMDPLSAY